MISIFKKTIFANTIIILCSFILIGGLFWSKPIIDKKDYTIVLPDNYNGSTDIVYISNIIENFKRDIRDEYNLYSENLDKKFTSIFSILGIAITAWVGLNIYNFIDKTEMDKLIKKYEELKIDMNIAVAGLQKTMEEIEEKDEQLKELKNELAELKSTYIKVSETEFIVKAILENYDNKEEILKRSKEIPNEERIKALDEARKKALEEQKKRIEKNIKATLTKYDKP